MKKLLIIAHDLPPIVRPQSIQIGRLLYHLPQDYHLYVVTADAENWQKDKEFYHNIDKKFTDVIKIAYNFFLRITGQLFRKTPDIFFTWHLVAYREIMRKWGNERFDCIMTFSFPLSSNLLGIWLKRYFHIPWIAFFSDPWADNPHLRYKSIFKLINTYLEQSVCKHADMLVFASPEMHLAYKKKYPFVINKSTFLKHSYDPGMYETIPVYSKTIHNKDNPLLSTFTKGEYEEIPDTDNHHLTYINISGVEKKKLIMRYIGAFYGERTIEPFLIALRKLLGTNASKETMLFVEVIGNIARKYTNQYARLLDRYDLGAIVKFYPPVSYRESLRLMQTADVLVLIDASIDGSVFLPSKLIDYIGSGRPIFAITPENSATSGVVRKVGGWLAEPNDADAMVKILHDILDNYKNGTLQQFMPSERISKEYSISSNMKKLVGILQGMSPDR